MISHFKGKYRLLPKLCTDTNDFPRTKNGGIDPDTEVYISCQQGNEISHYYRDTLTAYIPSLKRGHNIRKALDKQGISYTDYDETDEEVLFNFKASDIEVVAELMKARTVGANISPFSSKNLPKAKVDIPEEDMAKYKEIVAKVDKKDMLIFNKLNNRFLDEVLAKKLRPKGKRKPFDYKSDIKTLKLARNVKGYIWTKELWSDYLEFLDAEIDAYYNK